MCWRTYWKAPAMTTLDRQADAALKWGGLIVAAGSAYFSARYGLISSPDDLLSGVILAVVLIACCFCWAYLPAIAYGLWSQRKWGAVGVCAVATAVAASFDYVSTFGSLATIRGVDQHQAKVEKVVYDDKRDNVAEAKKKLAFFQEHMAALKTKQAWAGTRPPESFDGQIAAATLARDNEAKRGGCGPKCERLTRELAQLQAHRAMAVQWAQYEKQIEATQRILTEARQTAAAASPRPAASEFQNTAIASAVSFSLAPSATQVAWANLGISMLSGWFFLLFPMTANLLRKIMGADTAGAGTTERTSPQPELLTAVPDPAPAASTNTFQINGDPMQALLQVAKHIQAKQVTA